MTESAMEPMSLRASPIFAELSQRDLQNVVAVGRRESFDPGQVIVSKGDMGDAMYVMLAGSAEVDIGGRFHTLKPGDFFGEMALVAAKRRTATVKAVDAVEVLRIPGEGFRSFLLENPAVAVAILRAVVERLSEVQERIDAWMGTG
jgi:CRP-like cAMP-binding protein